MRLAALVTAVTLAFAFVPVAADAAIIQFNAAGADAAAIQSTVDAFRAAIGGVNNGAGGTFATGRREINWDGVPAGSSAPNAFPPDFFNVTSPRGVVFSTPGTGFQVSGTPPEFGNLNATYPDQFTTFSAPKLFTPIGSNVTDVNFFIPGTTTSATTRAFGAVFTDVDVATSSSIALFDANGTSLGTVSVQAQNQGLSFLGLLVDGVTPPIGRVRITSGNVAPGPNDAPGTDVAVMDDFIYGEPTTTVPEPTTLFLLGSALVGLGGRRLAQAVRALRGR